MIKSFCQIVLFFFLPTLFMSCQLFSNNEQKEFSKVIRLKTPSGDIIETQVAVTISEQSQGLSGVRPDDFDEDEAMLFWGNKDEMKNFWMPDTYFDLDLFYLDKDLKIIDIVRKLPHHIGRANTHLIPRARSVWSRHVLEMKSTSQMAQKLKIGEKLIWDNKIGLKDYQNKIKELTESQ